LSCLQPSSERGLVALWTVGAYTHKIRLFSDLNLATELQSFKVIFKLFHG